MIIIQRLSLASGKEIEIGTPWPGAKDQTPVSLIIENPEQTDEDSLEVTPAHYECWIFPAELFQVAFGFFSAVKRSTVTGQPIPEDLKAAFAAELNQLPQAVECRKVGFCRYVESTSEMWLKEKFIVALQSYFHDELELVDPSEADDDEDDAEQRDPGRVPVRATAQAGP